MKGKTILRIYYLFWIIIFLINVIYTSYEITKYNTSEKTTGVVTEVIHKRAGSSHDKSNNKHNITLVTYKYEVNGTEYKKELKLSGKKHYEEGDTVKLGIDSSKPEKSYSMIQIKNGVKMSILSGLLAFGQIIILSSLVKKFGSGNTTKEKLS